MNRLEVEIIVSRGSVFERPAEPLEDHLDQRHQEARGLMVPARQPEILGTRKALACNQTRW